MGVQPNVYFLGSEKMINAVCHINYEGVDNFEHILILVDLSNLVFMHKHHGSLFFYHLFDAYIITILLIFEVSLDFLEPLL